MKAMIILFSKVSCFVSTIELEDNFMVSMNSILVKNRRECAVTEPKNVVERTSCYDLLCKLRVVYPYQPKNKV